MILSLLLTSEYKNIYVHGTASGKDYHSVSSRSREAMRDIEKKKKGPNVAH